MKFLQTIALRIFPHHLFKGWRLETGGGKMPDEWIDKHTGHKVIRLSRLEGKSNLSFYFHNNPFIGNRMVFYSSDKNNVSKVTKQEIYSVMSPNRQIHLLDLETLVSEQVTFDASPMNGEIVDNHAGIIYYQIKDKVFSVDADTKAVKLVYVFPKDFKAEVTSINADGTLLAGVKPSDEEEELFKKYPGKSSYFEILYEAKLPRTLFTINVKTGELETLLTDNAWLNHVQFSPTSPDLLMFCHEGPWHKVDRIWTIDIKTKQVAQIHKRIMDLEIAGHEWFSTDGETIWYDLQQPLGQTFFVEGHNLKSDQKTKYQVQRNEWSIHFIGTHNDKLFCGDGADPSQVSKASDGKWIYLFTPQGDHFVSTKLVNMKHNNYKLEPNVHFSPDEKWVIFRANFEGIENIYAVEINKMEP